MTSKPFCIVKHSVFCTSHVKLDDSTALYGLGCAQTLFFTRFFAFPGLVSTVQAARVWVPSVFDLFGQNCKFCLGKTSSFEKVVRTPSSAELKSHFQRELNIGLLACLTRLSGACKTSTAADSPCYAHSAAVHFVSQAQQ